MYYPGASEAEQKQAVVVTVVFFVVVAALAITLGLDVIGPLAVGLGVIFVYGGLQSWYRERRELSTFEPTNGTIRLARVRGSTRKSTRIEYEYTVGGETYVNDKLWPGNPTKHRQGGDWADEFVGRYPEGSRVEIRYDPTDPAESFLEEKRHRWVWATTAVMGLFCILIGVMFWKGWLGPA